MYADYCGVLLLYILKVVPIYIYSHTYYYGSIHLMYTDYCGVLLLYIHYIARYSEWV